MASTPPTPVVHLELHTTDLHGACDFYAGLCGWRTDHVRTAHGSYLALATGGGVGSGVVECGTPRSLWLPYVEVCEVVGATQRARELGACVLLEPREGPAGRRSVVMTPAGAEIALWQQKR